MILGEVIKMLEERLDRIEGMLTQLLTIVGNMQTVQQEHGKRLDAIEKRMDALEARMDATDVKNDRRHSEIMDRFNRLEMDQDFIWEKAARNERELELIKRRLS
jgi:chromosome segregation ATPase